MATILVSGSAGFIGSHVVRALVARGDGVVGVDNFDPFYSAAIKRDNVKAAGEHELVEADICDAAGMGSLFRRMKPKSVIHLAGKAGVRPSIADPVGYARVNVLGTSIVLAEAARAGVSRVVIATSTPPKRAHSSPLRAPASPAPASPSAARA